MDKCTRETTEELGKSSAKEFLVTLDGPDGGPVKVKVVIGSDGCPRHADEPGKILVIPGVCPNVKQPVIGRTGDA